MTVEVEHDVEPPASGHPSLLGRDHLTHGRGAVPVVVDAVAGIGGIAGIDAAVSGALLGLRPGRRRGDVADSRFGRLGLVLLGIAFFGIGALRAVGWCAGPAAPAAASSGRNFQNLAGFDRVSRRQLVLRSNGVNADIVALGDLPKRMPRGNRVGTTLGLATCGAAGHRERHDERDDEKREPGMGEIRLHGGRTQRWRESKLLST